MTDRDGRLKNGMAIFKRTLHGTIVPVVLLIVWEALTQSGFINPQILPAPSQVLLRWIDYLKPLEQYDPANMSYLAWFFSGELPHDALASIIRVVGGFGIGAGLALPLGLLMGGSARFYQLMNPLVQLLRPIPPIAYIPLAILWFGLGNPPAFFLISLGAFFPVLMNTISGVRTVDEIYSCGPQSGSKWSDSFSEDHPARRHPPHIDRPSRRHRGGVHRRHRGRDDRRQ